MTPSSEAKSCLYTVHAFPRGRTAVLLALLAASLPALVTRSAKPSPAVSDVRRGVTLYVSRLGEDSDGRSWRTAFRTIQKALDAVPDDKGGHR
jgi:hypothetical protein